MNFMWYAMVGHGMLEGDIQKTVVFYPEATIILAD